MVRCHMTLDELVSNLAPVDLEGPRRIFLYVATNAYELTLADGRRLLDGTDGKALLSITSATRSAKRELALDSNFRATTNVPTAVTFTRTKPTGGSISGPEDFYQVESYRRWVHDALNASSPQWNG